MVADVFVRFDVIVLVVIVSLGLFPDLLGYVVVSLGLGDYVCAVLIVLF